MRRVSRVKVLRQRLDMTQMQFADAFSSAVAITTLRDWVTSMPRSSRLHRRMGAVVHRRAQSCAACGLEMTVKCVSKLHLRHVEALPQHLYARHRRILDSCSEVSGWASGRIAWRPRPLIGHGIETRPIGIAPRRWFTRFHDYPRSTGLAHVE